MCQESARQILSGRWPTKLDLDDRKNVDEVYWLDQLWSDPWRTFDPDNALVYVLPIYPVLLYHSLCRVKKRETIHSLADKAVKERNGGLDHTLMITDFKFKYPGEVDMVFGRAFATFARNMTQGRHLADNHRAMFGCAVTVPYTSSLTALQKAYQPFEKESLLKRGLIKPTDVFEDDRLGSALNPPSRHDWFERDYTMFFQGKLGHTRRYRHLAFAHLASWHYKPESCVACMSRNNVFVASDRSRSLAHFVPLCPRKRKTIDLLSVQAGRFERCWARTLNVLINELDDVFKYGIPFQCEIPWRNFTFAIEGSVFEQDPRKALQPVLDELYKDHRTVTEKLRLMDYYSKKILWNAPNSETARSVLRAMTRQCLTAEAKLDYIKRTSKDGTAANVRDHPLFSQCAFVDTSAKLEEQRKPCATCKAL
ncbi:unnamed protein product [Vitrella brassicaformis CCMP3155]|uniref:Uncharacterized protein n=1 Tax=Vitrella brassicaformis (strain CCMP3155) TaxID=1169540 RepID=A0A0G4GYV6_VITBC|nr:unnamed protein product [Vitrella brassicaformis CCMP3155]|eukprot:CEM36217.1 unnamed protein product [Vitrella brassicaformis CCMP3155]